TRSPPRCPARRVIWSRREKSGLWHTAQLRLPTSALPRAYLAASRPCAGGFGGGCFEKIAASARRAVSLSGLASASIGVPALLRRASRNRKSCAMTKNDGWPPRKGISAFGDVPDLPWQL